ncbi:hypothetical protein, partial [Salmonella enterica]|uniref:hypothetical protein n=1 Tax=Salmonella enterica TaxID=28901 RepID=UPI0019D403E7
DHCPQSVGELPVFPAPAGINRRSPSVNIWECRVPRASGDKPAELLNKAACAAVFPAPAGINRRFMKSTR